MQIGFYLSPPQLQTLFYSIRLSGIVVGHPKLFGRNFHPKNVFRERLRFKLLGKICSALTFSRQQCHFNLSIRQKLALDPISDSA